MRFLLRWTWRAILLALIALTALQFWFLVHVWYWNSNNPESTAFMRARLEILQEDDPRARLRHQWVPYQRISVHLKRAVVAAEDAKFATHNGFDWDGIQKAYEKNLREGEIVAGGSTITQQLAKNLFFSGERAWWRKAQEAVVAVMLETVMSKRRILEIYLNVIEWGDGVFGAEAAARYHYGTTAAALSPEQAARLAAVVPSPRRYGPGSNTAYLQRRTQTILARMNGAAIP
ncbi:MAG: monofunctional biosynthetic peptidoglycan transglycosylase [Burkholderiales bacterium]|jgi:monofunctional biosynthetic peptidoglycan transglycosylase|nr:monofunctional biosynthetic peptidoglycan transglycosylase [Burkholderiales bacterium]